MTTFAPLGYSRVKGFTLLEVIIASSIALFVFGIGYAAIATTVKASNESAARIRETENARQFFAMLERDLATAFPGPGLIQKKRETFASAGGYVHSATSDPSPMLMTEPVNSTYPSSDILQFYCRTEGNVLPNTIPPRQTRDELLFVRYYINKYDHTVCRQATVYDPNDPNQNMSNLPDYADPRPNAIAQNSDLALFENARTLAILFQRWNPATKIFDKEGVAQPTTCDSLQVTLIFTDQYKQARMDAYRADTTNVRYQANAYRTYSKVFAIPASFKQ